MLKINNTPSIRKLYLPISVILSLIGCAPSGNYKPISAQTITFDGNAAPDRDGVTIDDLLKIRDIDNIQISPDRQHIAFPVRQADVASNSYITEWFSLSTTGSQTPKYLGSAGTSQLASVRNLIPGVYQHSPAVWAPDSTMIAYYRVDSNRGQIWTSDITGGEPKQRTNSEFEIGSFTWARDGNGFYFNTQNSTKEEISNSIRAEGERGFRFDKRFSPGYDQSQPTFRLDLTLERFPTLDQRVHEATHYRYVELSSQNETEVDDDHLVRAALPSLDYDPDRLFSSINLSEAAQQRLNYQRFQGLRPKKFGPHLDSLVWADVASSEKAYAFPELKMYWSKDADGGERTACQHDDCVGEIAGFWGLDDGDSVVFQKVLGQNNSKTVFVLWNVKNNTTTELHSSHHLFRSCQNLGAGLICLMETPKNPARIVRLDGYTGSLSEVFDPNPEFKGLQKPKVERQEWSNRFGHRTFGHLVWPLNYKPGRRYPLVVVTYRSRGFLRGGVGDEYPIMPLASEDFMVLSFDHPDIGRYIYDSGEHTEYSMIHRKMRDDWFEYRSVLDLIDTKISSLIEGGYVDKNRIAVTGLSFGAAITHFALIHSIHDLKAASVSGAGYDPGAYIMGSDLYREQMRNNGTNYPFGPNPGTWEVVSSALNADAIDAAVLMQVADRELMNAMNFIVAMGENRKVNATYVFPNEYHNKIHPLHRRAAYERNLDWMKFWLMGKEDPILEKREQYQYWNSLREE